MEFDMSCITDKRLLTNHGNIKKCHNGQTINLTGDYQLRYFCSGSRSHSFATFKFMKDNVLVTQFNISLYNEIEKVYYDLNQPKYSREDFYKDALEHSPIFQWLLWNQV